MRYLFLRIFTAFALLCSCSACGVSSPTPPTESIPNESFSATEIAQDNTLLPSANPKFWDVENIDVSQVKTYNKFVALTFDDAPTSKLEELLSVFATFNEENPDCVATATLFCNGCLLNNATLHTLTASWTLGWELGNHTYSHADCSKLSPQQLQEELHLTDALLHGIDGKDKHLFRPPFGNLNDEQKTQILTPILYWTVDTLDWTGISAKRIVQTTLDGIYDGAIVLLHDGYPQTVQAVKALLPALKERGYQAVTISQLSKLNACPLKNGGAYIRARKHRTY
ncbi:MAG: polysaccharide deacetylase family protein [Clostridia bacterium]|nr:polysaccharide deacetylase family protein [Clostridia bacterium]